VPVRRVEAAGVHEANGGGETRGAEGGEVVDGGEENCAAGRGDDGVVYELEGVVCGAWGVGEEDCFAGLFGLGEEEGVALGG